MKEAYPRSLLCMMRLVCVRFMFFTRFLEGYAALFRLSFHTDTRMLSSL